MPLTRAVRAATENPAKAIGIERDFGTLTIGKYANIVLINEDIEIISIIKKGSVIL